jgi:SAM-dependent methyltransferase
VRSLYASDLAYIHDAGFGEFAKRAAPTLRSLLKKLGIRRGRVVELGCGSGTLCRELAAASYDVVGIDPSAAMLRLARRRAPSVAFRRGSLQTAELPGCSAIVAIGEVVTYLRPFKGPPSVLRHDRELSAFFRRARHALEPGGVLMFDFIESAGGRTYAKKGRTGRDWRIQTSARLNRHGTLLTRRITTWIRTADDNRIGREVHHVRVYSRESMKSALEKAGFLVEFRRTIGGARMIRGDLLVVARRPR